jgi:hypothetical protein
VHSLLQDNAYFNRPGEYVITLEQFMRSDSLAGMKAVGLVIEKTGKNDEKGRYRTLSPAEYGTGRSRSQKPGCKACLR